MRAAAIDFKKKTRNAEFVHLLLHHRGCNDIIGHGYYSIDGKDLDGRPTPKAWSGSHIIGDFPLTQPSLDAVNLYCEAMKPGSRFFTGTQFDEALYQKEIKEKLKMDVIQYLESTSIMAFPKYVSF